jgi:hypothetical protein
VNARRPLFNCIVAPLAAGPMSPVDAKAMLDNYRAEVLAEAADVVDAMLTAEPDTMRASSLYEVLLRIRGLLPCTCARSQGLHEHTCGRYVAGHDLLSPVRRLTAYRNETTAGKAGKDTHPGESTRVVAYRSNGGRLLRCLIHSRDIAGDDFVPVTSEDLPDGGICTYPDCGRDVLIDATEQDAPDFFQLGRTYSYGGDGYTAPELIVTFRVEHITTHPDTGERTAMGWARRGYDGWQSWMEPERGFPEFTLRPEDGEAR